MTTSSLAVKYDGPPDMQNDVLGGVLVAGETYEAPDREVYDELIAHPAGWFQPAKAKADKEA
jgi:hypothetical protein